MLQIASALALSAKPRGLCSRRPPFSTGIRPLIKILVVLMLLLIVASLASGLVFMIRDQGHGPRAVKALTVRVALSVGLFLILLLAYAAGLIAPHGL
jgi:FtsH-binding integral membrane protein